MTVAMVGMRDLEKVVWEMLQWQTVRQVESVLWNLTKHACQFSQDSSTVRPVLPPIAKFFRNAVKAMLFLVFWQIRKL